MNLKTANILVAATFIVSALGAVWMGVRFREELKNPREAQLLGPLEEVETPELSRMIDDFMEHELSTSERKLECAHRFLGRDPLYAFVELTCVPGDDMRGYARIEIATTGRPIRYDRLETGETRERSLRSLFPPEVRARMAPTETN